MSEALSHWVLVFGLPLLVVAAFYFLLEQKRYLTRLDGRYGRLKIKFTGPAALYLIIVTISIHVFPAPKLSALTIRLWPSTDLREEFLKDKGVRVYLSLPGVSEEYSDFASAKDFLEETQSVSDRLWGQKAAIRIAPGDKYALQANWVVLHDPLIELGVQRPGAAFSTYLAGTQGHGSSAREFVSATPVPLRTDLPAAIADLNAITATLNLTSSALSSATVLVSLEGQHLELDDRLEIVDAQGKGVPTAWVGDSVGAANGRPAAVSKDGRVLKAYMGLPAGSSSASYFLRVNRPGEEPAKVAISPALPRVD